MKMEKATPRPEHPRPDFQRQLFCNLNGEWEFGFDDDDKGLSSGWQKPNTQLDRYIMVPFCYQSEMSGIGLSDEIHPILWYRRGITVPKDMRGKRILLHFGAVDYKAMVFVNGVMVGTHEGGYTPFTLDITYALREDGNDLCLRVEDTKDCAQPRGKQYWGHGLMGCWYTPCSGIWQTVYMEAVGEYAIQYIHVTPDVDRHCMTAEIALDKMPKETLTVSLDVTFEGEPIRSVQVTMQDRVVRVPVDMIGRADRNAVHLWRPGNPALYDLRVRLIQGTDEMDVVSTYFGMRKIAVHNGQVLLNNEYLYQRLVLDQGYWPESLLTPPSDEAIKQDIQYTLQLGYNGARKHQKIEDPRYYYWADKMGLLVWGELPSAYDYSDDAVKNTTHTMLDFISRDFNHPSIITWVPANESWGLYQIAHDQRQQNTARMLYSLTKAADGTRLCSSNDGWEQVKTDICAVHDYSADGESILGHFADREDMEKGVGARLLTYAKGETPSGEEAFMITEYGGIAFSTIGAQGNLNGMETWGYNGKVDNEDDFFKRFQSVTDGIRQIPYCQGYCYTQLTDVMQEINGLLSPNRQPKVNIERFAAINRNPQGR